MIIFVNSNSTDKSFEDINGFIKIKFLVGIISILNLRHPPRQKLEFQSKYDWCCFMDFDIAFVKIEKTSWDIWRNQTKKSLFQLLNIIQHRFRQTIIMQTWGLGKKSPDSWITN